MRRKDTPPWVDGLESRLDRTHFRGRSIPSRWPRIPRNQLISSICAALGTGREYVELTVIMLRYELLVHQILIWVSWLGLFVCLFVCVSGTRQSSHCMVQSRKKSTRTRATTHKRGRLVDGTRPKGERCTPQSWHGASWLATSHERKRNTIPVQQQRQRRHAPDEHTRWRRGCRNHPTASCRTQAPPPTIEASVGSLAIEALSIPPAGEYSPPHQSALASLPSRPRHFLPVSYRTEVLPIFLRTLSSSSPRLRRYPSSPALVRMSTSRRSDTSSRSPP